MQTENPYQAPQIDSDKESSKEYSELNLFSANGRVGRLRFIAHLYLSNLAVKVFKLASIYIKTSTLSIVALPISLLIGYIIVCSFIKRLHDINMTGWWFLIYLIMGSLMFIYPHNKTLLVLFSIPMLFIFLACLTVSGSVERNKYGNPPPPNTFWVYFFSVGLFAIGVLLVLIVLIMKFTATH